MHVHMYVHTHTHKKQYIHLHINTYTQIYSMRDGKKYPKMFSRDSPVFSNFPKRNIHYSYTGHAPLNNGDMF